MKNHIQTLKEIQEEARRNKEVAATGGNYVRYNKIVNRINEILDIIEEL